MIGLFPHQLSEKISIGYYLEVLMGYFVGNKIIPLVCVLLASIASDFQ